MHHWFEVIKMEMEVSSYDQAATHIYEVTLLLHTLLITISSSAQNWDNLLFLTPQKGEKPNRDWPELFWTVIVMTTGRNASHLICYGAKFEPAHLENALHSWALDFRQAVSSLWNTLLFIFSKFYLSFKISA